MCRLKIIHSYDCDAVAMATMIEIDERFARKWNVLNCYLAAEGDFMAGTDELSEWLCQNASRHFFGGVFLRIRDYVFLFVCRRLSVCLCVCVWLSKSGCGGCARAHHYGSREWVCLHCIAGLTLELISSVRDNEWSKLGQHAIAVIYRDNHVEYYVEKGLRLRFNGRRWYWNSYLSCKLHSKDVFTLWTYPGLNVDHFHKSVCM